MEEIIWRKVKMKGLKKNKQAIQRPQGGCSVCIDKASENRPPGIYKLSNVCRGFSTRKLCVYRRHNYCHQQVRALLRLVLHGNTEIKCERSLDGVGRAAEVKGELLWGIWGREVEMLSGPWCWPRRFCRHKIKHLGCAQGRGTQFFSPVGESCSADGHSVRLAVGIHCSWVCLTLTPPWCRGRNAHIWPKFRRFLHQQCSCTWPDRRWALCPPSWGIPCPGEKLGRRKVPAQVLQSGLWEAWGVRAPDKLYIPSSHISWAWILTCQKPPKKEIDLICRYLKGNFFSDSQCCEHFLFVEAIKYDTNFIDIGKKSLIFIFLT